MTSNYPEQAMELPHKITLDGRQKLNVSGVKDVESFDEAMVVLITVRGTLVIHGENLHLQMLNLDGGQVTLDGRVDAMDYEDEGGGRQGFFARLLG